MITPLRSSGLPDDGPSRPSGGPTGGKPPPRPPRQPIFNVPPTVGALLWLTVGVFLAVTFAPGSVSRGLLLLLGFQPYRFIDGGVVDDPLAVVGLIGHIFLHTETMHLFVNMAGLIAFGPPVEHRLGPARFLVLYLVAGLFGIALDGVLSGLGNQFYLGASGAVTGLFGAVLVMLMQAGGIRPIGDPRGNPLSSLVVIVLVVAALNAVIGVVGLPGFGGGDIAWIAHIGGLFAGLALFPTLDRGPPGRRPGR